MAKAKVTKKAAGKSVGGSTTGKDTPKVATSGKLGVGDFTDYIYDAHPEWIVLCAEAPAERLSEAFAVAVKAKRRLTDVPVKSVKNAPGEFFPPRIPVVDVAGTSWSSALWLCNWPIGMDDVEQAEAVAEKLSSGLKARTLLFMGEDTSGAMDLQVYEAGKRIEHKEWMEDEQSDKHFAKWRVYIPPCFAVKRGDSLTVGAPPHVAARITRADVLEFAEHKK
jgi:hypothetical protein